MEVLIVAVVGVAFMWILAGRKDKHGPPPSLRRVPPKVQPVQNRPPFQAKTAHKASPGYTLHGKAYVVDGDTVVIQKKQIRLYGIDAPEMNHPYGKKAKWALVNMCKGHVIRADISETDAYGRNVARCYLEDGRDLSEEMVKQGLAIDWPKFSGGRYAAYEVPDVRKKLWLADARQKGRMHVWEEYEARQSNRAVS